MKVARISTERGVLWSGPMRSLLLALAVALVPTLAHAQGFVGAPEATVSGDLGPRAFGTSVAMSGDGTRVVVGQPDGSSVYIGRAMVYVRSGHSWTREATLQPSDAAPGDRVGAAVAITGDGTRIAVGAPFDATSPYFGAVRIYVRSGATWTLEQKLQVGGPTTTLANFGGALGLSDDGAHLIAGAAGVEHVYAFARSGSTWALEATLVASGSASGDRFGQSVAISGDGTRAVVGAPYESHGAMYTGSVYVFVRAGSLWTQELAYDDAALAAFSQMGSGIAIDASGTRIALDATAVSRVRFLVRTGTSWASEALFTTGIAVGGVALSEDGVHAIVGAPSESS